MRVHSVMPVFAVLITIIVFNPPASAIYTAISYEGI